MEAYADDWQASINICTLVSDRHYHNYGNSQLSHHEYIDRHSIARIVEWIRPVQYIAADLYLAQNQNSYVWNEKMHAYI